ncbi:stage V sporulation protein B [Desulfitispora alkaliphila]|uniref:putative polysaccharide biosynthesis protein n=1 Tax=Desulfitispora alkaliphila TaxID=622674 RepID=UPI003D22466A
MGDNSFLKGAAILAGAGLVTKLIGALYRIPFARMVGEEGMGLYQMAYPIYSMILAFSAAGIPVAISILVSERRAAGDFVGAQKVLLVALVIMLGLGLSSCLGLFLAAEYLAINVLHDIRAYYSLMVIAPALLFTALMAAFRGFFQGMQQMAPTAASQIVEQVFRVGTVLVAGGVLMKYGVEYAAAGATFGAVVGSFFGLLLLMAIYFLWKIKSIKVPKGRFGKSKVSSLNLTSRIITLAVPISLGGLVMPIMQTIDAAMVPLRLQEAGMDVNRATALFGQFSGMAATLINLPTIVTLSLAASLVPAISHSVSKGQQHVLVSKIREAIRFTVTICLPAAVGLYFLATPIGLLLYDIAEVGVSIRVLAPAALFLGLHQVTSGAIQGMGKTYVPVVNLAVGACVKAFCNYHLTAIPTLGIVGAGISTVLGFSISSALNILYLYKTTGRGLSQGNFLLKVALAATIMAVAIANGYPILEKQYNQSIATLMAIKMGIVVYGISLMLVGGVKRRDVEMIPKVGFAVASILAKFKLVR